MPFTSRLAQGVTVATACHVLGISRMEFLWSILSPCFFTEVVRDMEATFKPATVQHYELVWLTFQSFLVADSSQTMLEVVGLDCVSFLFHAKRRALALSCHTCRLRRILCCMGLELLPIHVSWTSSGRGSPTAFCLCALCNFFGHCIGLLPGCSPWCSVRQIPWNACFTRQYFCWR